MFKTITYFLAAVILSKPLGFLLTFILARYLGPDNFGVWMTLMLIISYSPIVSLGTVETLLKQIPYFAGKHDMLEVRNIENSVFGSLIISASVLIGLAVISPAFISLTSIRIESLLVVIVFLTTALGCFSAYFYHRFAAYENFKATANMDFLRAVLALLCIGGMAWKWNITGAALGCLLHESVMCFVLWILNTKLHGRIGYSLDPNLLLRCVRIGFPITLIWWSLTLTGSVDRLVLGGLLGAESVGQFGLGLSVSALLGLVPMVVGRVLYPRVNRTLATPANNESINKIVLGPTLSLSILLVNLQVILLSAMPFLYACLLPKYLPSLAAGQILMIGSFYSSLLRNGANFLIADNQQGRFFIYIVATLVSAIVFDVSLVWAGFGINGVALGTSIAGLVLTSLVWFRVVKSLGFVRKAAFARVLALYLPHFLLLVCLLCFRTYHSSVFRNVEPLSSALGCAALLFVVNASLLCLPLYRREILRWANAAVKTFRTVSAPATAN